MNSQQKHIIDLARRIARGKPVEATPKDIATATELIDWNKKTWQTLER